MPADIYTYLLAGGVGSRLSILSTHRAKPAVPFGGKYRIIDFTLSNAVNSGLYDIGVLTQYRPYSLNRHIGIGRPWDLDRKTGGVRLLQPYLGWRDTDWYRGTADAVLQNLDQVIERGSKLVLIVSGDHIYRMDYRKMLAFHSEAEAEVTIAVKPVPIAEASQFGIMSLDAEGRVVAFHEKPSDPPGNLASMGVYVFTADFLIAALGEMAEYGGSDFGRDVIPRLIRARRVFGYRFDGYWQDVGTLDAYYEANIALTREDPPFQLDDPSWNIYTVSHNEPAAKFDSGADVRSSIVASGSIIEGAVSDSVIFPGVHVRAGARVESSIILDGCDVGADTRVHRAILDKNVRTGRGSVIGSGDDSVRANETDPQHLFSGLNVVGRRSRLPDGIVIERNCLLFPDLLPEHFREARVPAGTSVLAGSGPSGVRVR